MQVLVQIFGKKQEKSAVFQQNGSFWGVKPMKKYGFLLPDGVKAFLLGEVEEVGDGGIVVVGNDAVEDGVLDGRLEFADQRTGFETEHLHDLVTHDRRLEVTDAVTLLEFDHLTHDEFVVVVETLDFVGVTRGDVGVAEDHQIAYIVACLKQQPAHGAVSDSLLDEVDRAHVQIDHLHDIIHLFVLREFERLEDAWHHLRADIIVVVERPSDLRLVVLGFGFADVV